MFLVFAALIVAGTIIKQRTDNTHKLAESHSAQHDRPATQSHSTASQIDNQNWFGSTAKNPDQMHFSAPSNIPSTNSNFQPMYGTHTNTVNDNGVMFDALQGGRDFSATNPVRKIEKINDFKHTSGVVKNNDNQNLLNDMRKYNSSNPNGNHDILGVPPKGGELPFEKIYVGPGLGLDQQVASHGGFHYDYRILPNNLIEDKNQRDSMKGFNIIGGVTPTEGHLKGGLQNNTIKGEMTTTKISPPVNIMENYQNVAIPGGLGKSATVLDKSIYDESFNNFKSPQGTPHTQAASQYMNITGNKYTNSSAGGPGNSSYPRLSHENNTNFRPELNKDSASLASGQPTSQVPLYMPDQSNSYIVNDTLRNNTHSLPEGIPGFMANGVPSGSLHATKQSYTSLSHNNMRSIGDHSIKYRTAEKGIIPQTANPEIGHTDIHGTTNTTYIPNNSQRGSHDLQHLQDLPGNLGTAQNIISNTNVFLNHRVDGIHNHSTTKTSRGNHNYDTSQPGIATGQTRKSSIDRSAQQKWRSLRGQSNMNDNNSLGLSFGTANSTIKKITNHAGKSRTSHQRESINNHFYERGPASVGSTLASNNGNHSLNQVANNVHQTYRNTNLDINHNQPIHEKSYQQTQQSPGDLKLSYKLSNTLSDCNTQNSAEFNQFQRSTNIYDRSILK